MWVNLTFFVTGDPRASICGSGRVYGQDAHFDVSTDDSKAPWRERLVSLLCFAIVVFSPVALCIALFWIFHSYSLWAYFADFNKFPRLLNFLTFWGILVPLMYLTYVFSRPYGNP